MQKSILVSLVTIGLLASVIGVGTYAYFSDTETSTGNTMTAGKLDLYVNNLNPITGAVFSLIDLKPSIKQETPAIELKIMDNPGKLYKQILVTSCETNDIVEPEQQWMNENNAADQNDFWTQTWFDLSIKVGEGSWAIVIPDLTVNLGDVVGPGKWIYLGQYDSGVLVNIKQSFHMKDTADNRFQSDKCTFTEVFRVEQTNAPMVGNCTVSSVPGNLCVEGI